MSPFSALSQRSRPEEVVLSQRGRRLPQEIQSSCSGAKVGPHFCPPPIQFPQTGQSRGPQQAGEVSEVSLLRTGLTGPQGPGVPQMYAAAPKMPQLVPRAPGVPSGWRAAGGMGTLPPAFSEVLGGDCDVLRRLQEHQLSMRLHWTKKYI